MVDPFELLKTLHSLSAVDERRAVELGELVKITGVDEGKLRETLRSLANMSYVSVRGAKIHLTELGIMKVNSMFC